MFLGFMLMLIMRYSMAYPFEQIPGFSWVDGENFFMPDGYLDSGGYNSLGAMHGTIMIFLGVVPLAVGAFGNYLVPLQVGACDMAFPD